MNNRKAILEKRWVVNLLTACAVAAFYVLLNHLAPVVGWLNSLWKMLSPIVIGMVLAYLLDPIAKFFEGSIFRGLRNESTARGLSVVLTVVCVLFLITLFFVMLIPSLIQSVSVLIDNMDSYYVAAVEIMGKISGSKLGAMLDLSARNDFLEDQLKSLLENLSGHISSILSASKNIGASIFNCAIGAVLAVYFLMGKKSLLCGLDRLRRVALRAETYDKHGIFWKKCHKILIQYIGCTLLDGLIVGIANAIFMMIAGMPYMALISVIVGVTNLLPTFGPIIGAVLGCFILVLDKPANAIIFLIFTLILQTVDGYILKPRLVSGSFGIPAVWTLIAIILGGKIFGVGGILLAIPAAAVIAFVYEDNFLPWLKAKRGRAIQTPEPEKSAGTED